MVLGRNKCQYRSLIDDTGCINDVFAGVQGEVWQRAGADKGVVVQDVHGDVAHGEGDGGGVGDGNGAGHVCAVGEGAEEDGYGGDGEAGEFVEA